MRGVGRGGGKGAYVSTLGHLQARGGKLRPMICTWKDAWKDARHGRQRAGSGRKSDPRDLRHSGGPTGGTPRMVQVVSTDFRGRGEHGRAASVGTPLSCWRYHDSGWCQRREWPSSISCITGVVQRGPLLTSSPSANECPQRDCYHPQASALRQHGSAAERRRHFSL